MALDGRHVAGVHFIYQFLCDKQNSKDVPQDTCPLSIQSNTHLGTAVKGHEGCNLVYSSANLKIERVAWIIQVAQS